MSDSGSQDSTSAPDMVRVMLGADCTIRRATVLREELLKHREGTGSLAIDGSNVEHIDTAGLQLILSFALDCLEQGREYVWCGQSAPLAAAIRLAGVGSLIESPGVPAFAVEA